MEEFIVFENNQRSIWSINKKGEVIRENKKRKFVEKITPTINNGYFIVGSNRYIHKLLGELFIPNPENKPEINHKDGNKLNNNLDNLEWMTVSENTQHAFDNGLTRTRKGQKHSKETREKMKKSFKNRVYNCVCKKCNSEFIGKIWNSSKCEKCK